MSQKNYKNINDWRFIIFYYPIGNSLTEIQIKGSRFIGRAIRVDNAEEARNQISKVREDNPGYTHVVYAFKIGDPKSEVCGMSDDGEPSGTAGRPVLNVLKGSEVINILITVVRYYGGTKLGTGGLVKAYTESAKSALENLNKEKIIPSSIYNMCIDYNEYDIIKKTLTSEMSDILDEKFSDKITIKIKVPDKNLTNVREKIKNITNGKIDLNDLVI